MGRVGTYANQAVLWSGRKSDEILIVVDLDAQS